MTIALPTYPGPADSAPGYVDFGGILRPFLGGVDQKLNRLGDRFALDVTMPLMPLAETGRVWIARLIRAQREGALMEWPQPGFDVGAPGNPVVNGAGQAGSFLDVRGLTPGYRLLEGQFFSIIQSGRRYLQVVAADIAASAGGAAVIPIAPMLRMRPANGAIVEIARPMIEGFTEGGERNWTLNYAAHVGLQFRIMEAA